MVSSFCWKLPSGCSSLTFQKRWVFFGFQNHYKSGYCFQYFSPVFHPQDCYLTSTNLRRNSEFSPFSKLGRWISSSGGMSFFQQISVGENHVRIWARTHVQWLKPSLFATYRVATTQLYRDYIWTIISHYKDLVMNQPAVAHVNMLPEKRVRFHFLSVGGWGLVVLGFLGLGRNPVQEVSQRKLKR